MDDCSDNEDEKLDKAFVNEYKDKFNFSRINNFGASFAKGEYLLLLNNDTEVITRKSGKYILLWALIGLLSIIAYFPLFWVVGFIMFIYFILVFFDIKP